MVDVSESIVVEGLTKKFGNFTAVNDISFRVNHGEIFGLLGPNGAGKTTTLSILSTIIRLTSGKASIHGYDVDTKRDDVRRHIGIVFQEPSLDDELTGWENLDMHARLYGVKGSKKAEAIHKVLKLVELDKVARMQTKTYSGGMKRRLEIARGFIHKPEILFLDEPTIGLDPQTRRKIWDYITDLNEKEKLTIILTTHYMEEADKLCDRIAIMDHGKIIKMGTSDSLKDSLGGDIIRIGASDTAKLARLLKKNRMFTRVKNHKDSVEVATKNGSQAIPKIIEIAQRNRIDVEYTTLKRPTLEDVFISLTGKEIRAESASDTDKMRNALRGRGIRR